MQNIDAAVKLLLWLCGPGLGDCNVAGHKNEEKSILHIFAHGSSLQKPAARDIEFSEALGGMVDQGSSERLSSGCV